VTKVVLQFLSDYADSMYALAYQAFLAGELATLQEQEWRGRMMATREVVDLQWESLLRFYDLPVPVKQQETADNA
jgi:hypothetical protein